MKTNIISKLLLSLSLVFVLGSAITQVRGDSPAIEPASPVVSIHSTGDVTRGKTGSFVVAMANLGTFSTATYVNVSVSGTAVPGVDYVAASVVSPIFIGASGYGVILIKTLPDRRALISGQKYSVLVTLKPGPGYTLGAPNSATMWIEPCTSAAGCQ
jgi:hypothetical protein